jgi:molybdate transport system substrate-binding protein
VMDIVGDLALGAVDAAVIWDAVAKQFKGIEAVDAPEFAGIRENASAAVVVSSTQPALAQKFVRCLAAPENGGAIFRAHGYTPVAGTR